MVLSDCSDFDNAIRLDYCAAAIYLRRGVQDEFKKQASVRRSLSADKKRIAKTKVPKGQGTE